MDRIEISGLRAVGRHGVLEEEKARSQPFEVDVVLMVDLHAAGASDDLQHTVDYGSVSVAVARIVEHEQFELIERLATRIAEECRRDPKVVEVTVTVRKLRPPIPVALDTVAVTVTR